jgi:Flp pilus assembly protein TadD
MLGFALGALPAQRASAWGRFGALRPALALVAVAAIIPQYVILAAGSHLRNSQNAFSARDGSRARSEALAAKAIEPWAANPYLQLGFVAEAEQHYGQAVRWADEAIKRSRRDWSIWATAAAFETSNGNVAAARRDLAEARRLNPHSLVLAEPKPGGG